MVKSYSIAEARDQFATIVHNLEKNSPVEVTRRGKPVAILLSIEAYQRLQSPKTNFGEAYTTFLQTVDDTDLPDEDLFTGIHGLVTNNPVDYADFEELQTRDWRI